MDQTGCYSPPCAFGSRSNLLAIADLFVSFRVVSFRFCFVSSRFVSFRSFRFVWAIADGSGMVAIPCLAQLSHTAVFELQ